MIEVKNPMLEGVPEVQGIYCIRNRDNNKKYVGSSNNIRNRIGQHFRELEKGKHHSHKLQRDYNLTKKSNKRISMCELFEIDVLEIIDDNSILKDREQYWIDTLETFEYGYNCCALVDNPYYCAKKVSIRLLYDKFWALYNPDKVIIGDVFLGRIKTKHYKARAMTTIILFLESLIPLYPEDEYSIRLFGGSNKLYAEVYDNNKNKFAEYTVKNKTVCIQDMDTKMLTDYLKYSNLYNESIHKTRVNAESR